MTKHSTNLKNAVLELDLLEDRITPTNAQFVAGLYANLLHRTASASESAGWIALLNEGVAPSVISTAFVNTLEYQANVIRSSYQIFLSRQPSNARPRLSAGAAGQRNH